MKNKFVMKNSELYRNEYPLESILPELDYDEVTNIIAECDYTIESDRIAVNDNFPESMKVNQADAIVFYHMGYEAARRRLERVLIPMK
jgi:hypothetical protein